MLVQPYGCQAAASVGVQSARNFQSSRRDDARTSTFAANLYIPPTFRPMTPS